jgi:excisionase family DNA binding protein
MTAVDIAQVSEGFVHPVRPPGRVRAQCRRAPLSANDRSNDPRPTRLPSLLTPDEVAALLRTSRKAIYAMLERGQLPGIVRLGRRVLIREDALVDWLGQKSLTPSSER